MKILAIETSCDETAIAILEAESLPDSKGTQFRILGNALISQIELHRKYGGVFPTLAKREHAKNLVPILEAALEEAELLHEDTQAVSEETQNTIATLLEREPGLNELFLTFISETEPADIDVIAVTAGPGLEPALWVGINFARALALAWQKPLIAVNHMEGHILSALAENSPENSLLKITEIKMPIVALLISGGHTELVLMKEWLSYELLGQTRDDAVGEAFDKVARMLGLPYPGGPEISKLAESIRYESNEKSSRPFILPRPMIHDDSCDFSFSGLKTAVMNLLKKQDHLTDLQKKELAHEFENAVTEVLWKKTERAIKHTDAQTLIIGGGVSANTHIRRTFTTKIEKEYPHITFGTPANMLATDNAIMIALAGYYRAQRKEFINSDTLTAQGNLSLA